MTQSLLSMCCLSLSSHLKRPSPLSLSLYGITGSVKGWESLGERFAGIVTLQSTLAEVSPCTYPSPFGLHLGENALHVNKLLSKTTQP